MTRPGDRVEVPAELAELIPRFLKNRLSEFEQLRLWLEAADHEAIRALAHAIKGTAGGYHFHLLAEQARELEAAARLGDAPAMRAALSSMAEHLARVEVVLVP